MVAPVAAYLSHTSRTLQTHNWYHKHCTGKRRFLIELILKQGWIAPIDTVLNSNKNIIYMTAEAAATSRHGAIVIDYSFLSNRNRLNWPKMKCNRLHCQFNHNRRLRSRLNLKSSPYITVRWTSVMVAIFPPLSSFVMAMFQGRLLPRLCALNPDSPTASTAFVANSHFVVASPLVGRQK